MNDNKISRRTFIKTASLTAAGALTGKAYATKCATDPNSDFSEIIKGIEPVIKNGRINQATSYWPFKIKKWSLDKLCAVAKKIGIKGIDLLQGPDLATAKEHGLICSMVDTHSLKKGMNNKNHHAECIAKIREAIDAAAQYNFPNVVGFSGNGAGLSDAEGLANAVEGFKQIIGYAEEKKVTICVEYLNSKVNHPDYMFDHLDWGIKLCNQVGSENLKILFDIYHAQISEGDIIRKIRQYHQYFGHYHTAGNPGRNEIDDTQEINYPAIMRAIVETGYKGYVAHEFIPKRDPLESLKQAVRICDV